MGLKHLVFQIFRLTMDIVIIKTTGIQDLKDLYQNQFQQVKELV